MSVGVIFEVFVRKKAVALENLAVQVCLSNTAVQGKPRLVVRRGKERLTQVSA